MAIFAFMPGKTFNTMQFDALLDSFMQLDFKSRERMLNILSERQKEARGVELLKEADQATSNYRNGKYKALNATELNQKLNTL